MAITIVDEPYETSPAGQKLIVVATSDNTSEDGFMYKVRFAPSGGPDVISYMPPNAAGALIWDYSSLIKVRLAETITEVSVHNSVTPTNEPFGDGLLQYNVYVEEAWIEDGILTDQGSPTEIADLIVWPAKYQVRDGYKPDPTSSYALSGNQMRWLSVRAFDTHKPPATFGYDLTHLKIFIPVRESDWGVLSMITGLGEAPEHVNYTIIASNGTPITWDVPNTGQLVHFPAYPANLNNTDDGPYPSDYPGWRYIQIRAEDAGDIPVSVNYILYNVDVYGNMDCRYDVIRLGWQNERGGWDYFNFIKKSEFSDSFDRKRYRKIIGDYSGAEFSASPMARGLTEREILADTFLVINSDWIQENEFIYLRSLFASEQVHWVQDGGDHIPVVVEDSDYTQPNTRAGGLKNLTIKLRISSEYYR